MIARRLALVALLGLTQYASAQNPRMGGPMKHIMVHLHGHHLEAHVDDAIPTPVLKDYNETYGGNAAVLNGRLYNAQYGWMADGFWTPPQDTYIWIRQLDATPGLDAYHGGTMMNQGTFNPIFGTAGSVDAIRWDGRMLHNWYAVDAFGDFRATYEIYFADADGARVDGYEPALVELMWSTSALCPADFNRDEFLDYFDLDAFVLCFEGGDCPPGVNADFNGDGFVDFFDADAFLSAIDAGC